MYKSHEQRQAEWHQLARLVGVEDIPRMGVKGYLRRRQREYAMPKWMLDNEIVRTFLTDHFPKFTYGAIHSFLQNHWRNQDHQYWQMALWLAVISKWFRNGMSENETAQEITAGRIFWLDRMRYRRDERNMKKIVISPSQVAKIVEHIKNVARGWNPKGRTRAERILNCPRQNGSPREFPSGQIEDSNGNPVFLAGTASLEEINKLLAKIGMSLRGQPRKTGVRPRGRPRKNLAAQADTETK